MDDGTWIGGMVFVGVWILAVIGWIMNIVKLVGADFATVEGLEVARIIGVAVAPLGAVLGFL